MPPDGHPPCGCCSAHRFQCHTLRHYHGQGVYFVLVPHSSQFLRFPQSRNCRPLKQCRGKVPLHRYADRGRATRDNHRETVPEMVFLVGCGDASCCGGSETGSDSSVEGDDKKPYFCGGWHTSHWSFRQNGARCSSFFLSIYLQQQQLPCYLRWVLATMSRCLRKIVGSEDWLKALSLDCVQANSGTCQWWSMARWWHC